jgi:hypothetical protein
MSERMAEDCSSGKAEGGKTAGLGEVN